MRIVVTTVTVAGVVTLIATTFRYIQPVIQNRNLWAAVTLIAIILFTSGHMFNHIRKVPYVTQDQRGRIAYFTGGFQNQLGIETQIVAAMCKLCHPGGFYLLNSISVNWAVLTFCRRRDGFLHYCPRC